MEVIEQSESASSADNVAQPARISTLGLIASDIRAWHRIWYRPRYSDPANPPSLRRYWRESLHLVWAFPGLRAAITFRISYGLKRRRIPALPQMVAAWNLSAHGLDIPSHIEIGPGLYIPHPVGNVVMASRIGANVTLVSCITIGMRGENGFPTIGDNVYIGAGARVLGGIHIGDDASIGANAVVLKDVPPGATAVGVPAVIKLPARPGDARASRPGLPS